MMVYVNSVAAALLLAVLSLLPAGGVTRATRESTHYDAVVVEYAPLGVADADPPLEVLARNWAKYELHISQAKDADIIVFPECGLTGMQLPTERPRLRPLLTRVPDPATLPAPCDAPPAQAPSASDVLRNASCAARRHGVYVVLNLPEEAPCSASESDCPDDGAFIYNTNVVLDRNGTLIARYRKVHLFVEPGFDRPRSEEPVVFETDFGVRFATFICFDLLFEAPALRAVREMGATDIAYSTAWFSELPFLTAVQTQAGWARAANVTLLAAGLDRPSGSNGGSGAFWGDGGALKAEMPRHRTTAALRVRVPKRPAAPAPTPAPTPASTPAPTPSSSSSSSTPSPSSTSSPPSPSSTPSPPSPPAPAPVFNLTLPPPPVLTSKLDDLNLWQDDVRAWATVLLPPAGGVFNASLCHGALCCRVEALTQAPPADAAPAPRYFYRVGAFDGVRNFARKEALGVQVCGVFACLDAEGLGSCGRAESGRAAGLRFERLAVRGSGFLRRRALQMPSTLDAVSLLPLPAGDFRFRAACESATTTSDASTMLSSEAAASTSEASDVEATTSEAATTDEPPREARRGHGHGHGHSHVHAHGHAHGHGHGHWRGGRGRAYLQATRPLDASLLAFGIYGRAFDRDRPFDQALPPSTSAQ